MNTTSLCLLAIIIVMASCWYTPVIVTFGLLFPFLAHSVSSCLRCRKSHPNRNELVEHMHFI